MALPAHTSHYVTSGDVTLHYRLFGKPGESSSRAADRATPMLVLHGAAWLGLLSQADEAQGWVNLDLYRALSLEGIAIWGAALVAGIAIARRTVPGGA